MSARPFAIILGIALAGAIGVTVSRRLNPPAFELLEPRGSAVAEEVPRLWAVHDFTLTDKDGKPASLAQLRGHLWVVDFFYTTCPGPCPMLTSRFSQLQKDFANRPDVRFVSITTDPEKDTPEVLRTYAEHFQASDRWLFLTGEKKTIFDLANNGFKLALQATPAGSPEPVIHSTKLLLVDRQGTVRGVYDGLGEEGKGKLLHDIQRLLAEP